MGMGQERGGAGSNKKLSNCIPYQEKLRNDLAMDMIMSGRDCDNEIKKTKDIKQDKTKRIDRVINV